MVNRNEKMLVDDIVALVVLVNSGVLTIPQYEEELKRTVEEWKSWNAAQRPSR